jgi:hypothetical protein
MKLVLAKKKLFEGFEIECYMDTSTENGDFFMTINQVAQAVEADRKTIEKNIERKRDLIGKPVTDKLSATDGKEYETALYSFEQYMWILDGSRLDKAILFKKWTIVTLQELITGRAELKFAKQEDEQTYKEKISTLTEKVDTMTVKVDIMEKTMGTLINSATINSYQAKQLNKLVRERISTMLGGAHSKTYKQNSRMYFKNLWLGVCDTFNVSEYRDLNPLHFSDAVTYINNWSLM